MNQQYSEILLLITIIVLFITLIILNFGGYEEERSLIFKKEGIVAGIPAITGMSAGPVTSTVYVLGQPPAPNLSGWLQNLGGYSNGTILLNWSVSYFPDIKEFILYKKTNFSADYNFNSPYQIFSNTTFNYSDIAVSVEPEVYYTMLSNASYDSLSEYKNEDIGKSTRALYATGANRQMNLVSVPVDMSNKSVEALFVQTPSNFKVSQVYRRNDVTGRYLVVDYYDDIDMWYGDFYNIDPGYAYWIKVTSSFNLSSVGSVAPVNRNWPIYATSSNRGMNMFGWASVKSESIQDVFHNTPSNFNVSQVYRRNDVTGRYLVADYYDDIDLWYGDFYDFEPGYGYWIKTSHNMTMNYEANVR
jgi:hypothetical protein